MGVQVYLLHPALAAAAAGVLPRITDRIVLSIAGSNRCPWTVQSKNLPIHQSFVSSFLRERMSASFRLRSTSHTVKTLISVIAAGSSPGSLGGCQPRAPFWCAPGTCTDSVSASAFHSCSSVDAASHLWACCMFFCRLLRCREQCS